LGQGGSHSITDSTFENNQALSGGAIYVQDKADSIQIVNSQFVNNQAIVNGGALIFIDQSKVCFMKFPLRVPGVKNSLTISQATFLQNMANLGGAIYLGNQALKVDSSSFIENSALQGGAIATKTSGKNFYNHFLNLHRCLNKGSIDTEYIYKKQCFTRSFFGFTWSNEF